MGRDVSEDYANHLEKFLADEALPSVGGITTRTYQFNQQSLLSYSDVVGPDPLHDIQKAGVAAKLATLCRITTDKNLYVVMDSGTASGGSLDS